MTVAFQRSIILLSGPLAVGKTSVRDKLVLSGGFQPIRSSTYLKTIADGASGRRSLQEIGDRLDLETDYRWLLDRVATPAFEAEPERRLWLVDAVRKSRQVEHFRQSYESGTLIFHAHLDAPESILKQRFDNRQQGLGENVEGMSYETAIDHDNERSARALKAIADKVYDTSTDLPEVIAASILRDVQAGSGASLGGLGP
jgi:hypothetical protein